jgi:mono/diheme cytochrome c family protein
MSATTQASVLLLLALAACGGGDRAGQADTTGMASTPPPSTNQAAVTPAAPESSTTGMAPAAPDSAATVNSRGAATTPGTATQDTGKKATAGQDTGKKAAAAKPAAKPAASGASGPTSPKLVALGDSIFHGQVAGGTCTACHGQDAKGTAVAPDLTDNQWINGDGSYQFIVHTVHTGVPQPKQHPAPMPPMGGATLTDEQVNAVAAYVYSLSHKS